MCTVLAALWRQLRGAGHKSSRGHRERLTRTGEYTVADTDTLLLFRNKPWKVISYELHGQIDMELDRTALSCIELSMLTKIEIALLHVKQSKAKLNFFLWHLAGWQFDADNFDSEDKTRT